MIVQKVEPGDIDGYQWNWGDKFGDDVMEELIHSYAAALSSAAPDMAPGVVQRLAGQYAEARGGLLIQGLELESKRRMGALIDKSIREGVGIGTIQERIIADYAFSPQRATLIARTETAKALGQGQKAAAVSQGQDQKKWVTQGDSLVRDEHVRNEAAGWISITDPFPSGEDTVGLFNCRCNVVYRTKALHEPVTEGMKHRCPDCGTSMVVNKDGPGGWCRRCQQVVS